MAEGHCSVPVTFICGNLCRVLTGFRQQCHVLHWRHYDGIGGALWTPTCTGLVHDLFQTVQHYKWYSFIMVKCNRKLCEKVYPPLWDFTSSTVKSVLRDDCHERPQITHFSQKDLHFNITEPVTKDHLSWQTTFLWPVEWPFKTGSTVVQIWI